jgi:hypothetical protein
MKVIFLITSILIFGRANACLNGDSLLPENDLRIPVGQKNTGITESQFNNIIDDFQILYEPIFKEKGNSLKINNKWKSPIVNARAHTRGRIKYVTMFGGMARHEEMTEFGFAMVLCHEIGHHLGGAPTYFSGVTNEGQSDYFAGTKCMRRWLKTKDFTLSSTDPYLYKKCSEVYTNQAEIDQCIQTSFGGMSLARIFAQLQSVEMPKFSTPDTTIISSTSFKHPAAQCRLDTYFQAALCDNDINTPFSTKDEALGACYRANGNVIGARSLCWFKPKS